VSYGLELFNSVGQKIFGMDSEGGLFLGLFGVAGSGANVVLTFPAQAGRTLMVAPVSQNPALPNNPNLSMSLALCTVDYALGYPRVTAVPAGRSCFIYVFVQ
jgi:hypothetical protein